MESFSGAVLVIGFIAFGVTLATTGSALAAFVMMLLAAVVTLIVLACIGTLFQGNLLGILIIVAVFLFLMSIFEKKK